MHYKIKYFFIVIFCYTLKAHIIIFFIIQRSMNLLINCIRQVEELNKILMHLAQFMLA